MESDFEKPVGLHIWTSLRKSLEVLHTYLLNNGDQIVWTSAETVNNFERSTFGLKTKEALTEFKTLSKRKKGYKEYVESARSIADCMWTAKSSLKNWFPGHGNDKMSRDDMQAKFNLHLPKIEELIMRCISIANEFAAYCQVVTTAKKKSWGYSKQCELSLHLEREGKLTKKKADEICNSLGAVLIKHLIYVEADDVSTLNISDNEKTVLQSIVNVETTKDMPSPNAEFQSTKLHEALAALKLLSMS